MKTDQKCSLLAAFKVGHSVISLYQVKTMDWENFEALLALGNLANVNELTRSRSPNNKMKYMVLLMGGPRMTRRW